MSIQRKRVHHALFIAATIAVGLFSRSRFTPFDYPHIGDALYALMIFFGVGFLFPRMSSPRVVALSVGFCFLLEFGQLYQADWINAIRSTRLGGLVLGFGFLWGDLISYTVGGVVGWALEVFVISDRRRR